MRAWAGCLVLLMAAAAGCAPSTATPLPWGPQNITPPGPAPTTTPVKLSTVTPPPDVVHLGMAWADFSLRFDPAQWQALPFRSELPGVQELLNRSIPGCEVTPNVPAGFELHPEWTMQDGQITLGDTTFTTRRFFQNGQLKFAAYYGFLGNRHDGAAEVHFQGDPAACLAAAEELFAHAEVIRPAPTATAAVLDPFLQKRLDLVTYGVEAPGGP